VQAVGLEHALQLLMALLQGRQLTPLENYVDRQASASTRKEVTRRRVIKATPKFVGKMKLL
jgi:hypothetical protein